MAREQGSNSAMLRQKFEEDGYLIIEDFATDNEVEEMKMDCYKLVEDMNPDEHNTVFSTTGRQAYRNEYFINSADKIGYFFEEKAKDENGKLLVDKHKALNKIGHALHIERPAFRKFTYGNKVKELIRSLEFVDPVICQSMYIFKQPFIGGAVTNHQDATFLYAEPLKVVGLWVALEDTTLENGCLWFIPGSHKNGISNGRRMIRNPDKLPTAMSTIFTAEEKQFDHSLFVPTPIKKGSAILIHGLVVHKSEANKSPNSRHIYTFHVFEQHNAVWSDKNWLQPTPAGVFSHLYDGS